MNLSDTAKALMVEPFREDHEGKPVAEFEMACGPAPRREIETPHHSLKVLPLLQAIDDHIDQLLANIGVGADYNPLQQLAEWEALSAHGSKLMAQAFYLDTADRNSWYTIKQTYLKTSGEQTSSRYARELKRLWHGALEDYLEDNKPLAEPGLSL